MAFHCPSIAAVAECQASDHLGYSPLRKNRTLPGSRRCNTPYEEVDPGSDGQDATPPASSGLIPADLVKLANLVTAKESLGRRSRVLLASARRKAAKRPFGVSLCAAA